MGRNRLGQPASIPVIDLTTMDTDMTSVVDE